MRIDRGAIIAYAIGWLIGMALLLVIVAALNVAADGDTSPPECPPGVVCELPTATAPSPTGEPYPPPGGYPGPYPAPGEVFVAPVFGGWGYP